MSTENEVIEEAEVPENTEETAEEAKAETEPEEEPKAETEPEEEEREKLQWPGAKGEGEIRLHFFDIVGLPETLEDETDPTCRIMLALVAEVQQLRIQTQDLKDALQYMSLESFIQSTGRGGSSPNRPAPMAMRRIAGK